MSKNLANRKIKSSAIGSADIRRYGALRRSVSETLAQRRLVRLYALSPAHARVIAELQGYHG